MELREETYVTAKVGGHRVKGRVYTRESGCRVIYDNDEDKLYLFEGMAEIKVNGKWTLRESEDLAKEGIASAVGKYDWKRMSQDPNFNSLRQDAKDAAVTGATDLGMTEDEAGKLFDEASAAEAVQGAAEDAEQGNADEAAETLEKFEKNPVQEAMRLFVVGRLNEAALKEIKGAAFIRECRRYVEETDEIEYSKKKLMQAGLSENAAAFALSKSYSWKKLMEAYSEAFGDDDFEDTFDY
jgi:hypothetical protein